MAAANIMNQAARMIRAIVSPVPGSSSARPPSNPGCRLLRCSLSTRPPGCRSHDSVRCLRSPGKENYHGRSSRSSKRASLILYRRYNPMLACRVHLAYAQLLFRRWAFAIWGGEPRGDEKRPFAGPFPLSGQDISEIDRPAPRGLDGSGPKGNYGDSLVGRARVVSKIIIATSSSGVEVKRWRKLLQGNGWAAAVGTSQQVQGFFRLPQSARVRTGSVGHWTDCALSRSA